MILPAQYSFFIRNLFTRTRDSDPSGKFEIRNSQKGFTLIELLIVMSIIVILTSISVVTYSTFYRMQDFNNTRNDLINTLQVARSRALSQYAPATLCNQTSPQIRDYQVQITQSTSVMPQEIVLYVTCNDAGGSLVTKVHSRMSVPPGVSISPQSGSLPVIVTFTVQGGAAPPTTFNVSGIQIKQIRVEANGRIVALD